MSTTAADLNVYGSANMPEADTGTVGGAVDLTRMVSFSDLASATLMDVVSSSGSDTATKIAYYGRDSAGVVQNQTLTLNGTSKVAGNISLSRLLYGALSGASANGPVADPGGTPAVGDVALISHTLVLSARTCQAGSANATGVTPPVIKLQSGDGASITLGMIIRLTGGTGSGQIRTACSTSGTGSGQYGTDIIAVNRDWSVVPDNTTTYEVGYGFLFPILPNPVTSVTRPFAGVTADVVGGSTRVFYEKIGFLNTNSTTALTAAAIAKTVDPSGLYAASGALDFALCTSLNDTSTTTNRLTAPTFTGTSFTSGAAPQSLSVPSPGNLAAGNSASNTVMAWLRLTLPAAIAPTNTSFQMKTSGNTI